MRALLTTLVLLAVFPSTAGAAVPRLHVEPGANAAIVDESGRQVLLRGINVNQLGDYFAFDPARRTTIPLTRADLEGIDRLGFNVVRLVLNWSALEPAPGQIDAAYLARIREVVGWARELDLYVVLDMHQDSWGKFIATPPGATCPPGLGPAVGWDGAPEWATKVDGMTTCRAADTRELSPAVAQAFTNFYADRDGIQTALVQVWERLAREFGGEPNVAGYDLLNEPHPGFLIGPDQSVALGQFYARAIAAIRAGEKAAPGGFAHPVFFEPSVVWSGFGADALPPPGFTPDDQIVFAPHLYSESITVDRKAGLTTVSIEQGFEAARQAAASYGAPLWNGEWAWFGKSADDAPKVERFIKQEDASRIGGAWWVWKQACGDPHVSGAPTFSGSLNPVSCPGDKPLGLEQTYTTLITRPYPRFAPGRLGTLTADAKTARFSVAGRDDDAAGSCRLEVWVPERPGAGGPQVSGTGVSDLAVRRVTGGWVVSACARGAYTLTGAPGPPTAACRSRRVITLTLRARDLRRVRVRAIGARAVRIRGRRVTVDLRGTPRTRVTVVVTARRRDGRPYAERRVYRTCARRST
jgi:endoglycosylceramidase